MVRIRQLIDALLAGLDAYLATLGVGAAPNSDSTDMGCVKHVFYQTENKY